MSEMRKLIDLVEEATIDSYMDRLIEATTQEEFDNILKEAELYEAPGMVDKIKQGAKNLGLGALAVGSMMGAPDVKGDTPADMDPGVDSAYTQTASDPVPLSQMKFDSKGSGGLNDGMKQYYPTSKHFDVADNILKQEYKEYQAKQVEVKQLRQKELEWAKQNVKNYVSYRGVFKNTPYSDDLITLKAEVRQAGHDYLASLRLLSNVVKLNRYKDNPDRLANIVAPATGADAAIENFKLYLQKVKPFEAGPSAERNVPK